MFDRIDTRTAVVVLSVCIVFTLGCPTAHQPEPKPKTGGGGTYVKLAGTATVVYVADVTDSAEIRDYGCSDDPESVMFTWQADDPEDPGLSTYEQAVELMGWTMGGRRCLRLGHNCYYPPGEWVELEGLTPESQHACEAAAITEGAGTPVIYTFLNLDYDTLQYYGCE